MVAGTFESRLQSDGQGAALTIQSGSQTVVIEDVLVGEVWLASGQSNMVFSMNRVPSYAEIIATSAYPQIRMFNAPNVTAVEPQNNIEGKWSTCSPATVPGYSAVAFSSLGNYTKNLRCRSG